MKPCSYVTSDPHVLDGPAPLLRPRLQSRTDPVLDRGPDTGQRLDLGLLITLTLSFLTGEAQPISAVSISKRTSRAQHSGTQRSERQLPLSALCHCSVPST